MNEAIVDKMTKYSNLATTHLFVPLAIESAATYTNVLAVELIEEIGNHTSAVRKEHLETYLFQRISMAIQRALFEQDSKLDKSSFQ